MKRMYRQEFGNRRNFANDEISSIGLRKKVSSRGEQNEERQIWAVQRLWRFK